VELRRVTEPFSPHFQPRKKERAGGDFDNVPAGTPISAGNPYAGVLTLEAIAGVNGCFPGPDYDYHWAEATVEIDVPKDFKHFSHFTDAWVSVVEFAAYPVLKPFWDYPQAGKAVSTALP
jgi:hypothetical protein